MCSLLDSKAAAIAFIGAAKLAATAMVMSAPRVAGDRAIAIRLANAVATQVSRKRRGSHPCTIQLLKYVRMFPIIRPITVAPLNAASDEYFR